MSKRLILILSLIVLLALAAGAVFYLEITNPIKIDNLTELVSSGAFVYISGRNIDEVWGRIKKTDIYSQVINSSLFEDRTAMKASKEEIQQEPFASFSKFRRMLAGFREEELKAVLGKEALLAVFCRGSIIDESPEFDVVLLSRIKQTDKIKEPVFRFISRIKGNNPITTRRYKGFKINTVQQEELKDGLVYLILGDVFILSNNFRKIEETVDLFRGEYAGGVSADAEFRRNKDKLSDNYSGWIYSDIDKLKQLFKGSLEEEAYALQFNLNLVSSYFLEFNLDEGLYIRGWGYFDFEKMKNERLKAAWQSVKNIEPEILKFAPLNVAMFCAGNTGDINLSWSYIKEEISEFADKPPVGGEAEGKLNIGQFISQLNSMLGFDLEKDLLPYLGEEYGFSLAGFKDTNIPLTVIQSRAEPVNLSFPEMFGCIRVTDKDKIAAVMQGFWQRIVDTINMQIALKENIQDKEREKVVRAGEKQGLGQIEEPGQTEDRQPQPLSVELDNYSGINIHSLKFLPGALPLGISEDILSPAYCFLEDYLIVSSNSYLLKKIINVHQKKNLSLNDSIKFSQIKHRLHREFSNLTYICPGELIEPMLKMISLRTDDIKQQEQKRKFIEIMNIIKNIKSIGSTTVHKDKVSEFYIFMPVEGN